MSDWEQLRAEFNNWLITGEFGRQPMLIWKELCAEVERMQSECGTWEKNALELSHKVYTIREFLRNAPVSPEAVPDIIMEMIERE